MSKTGLIICAFSHVFNLLFFLRKLWLSSDIILQISFTLTLNKPTNLFSFSSLRSNSTYALKNKNMRTILWKLLKMARSCARVMLLCHNCESDDVRSLRARVSFGRIVLLTHYYTSVWVRPQSDAVVLMVGGIPRSFSSSLYLLHQTLIIANESPEVILATFTANCLCISWRNHVFTCVHELFCQNE